MDIRQMKKIIGKKSCSNPLEEIHYRNIRGCFIMSELASSSHSAEDRFRNSLKESYPDDLKL